MAAAGEINWASQARTYGTAATLVTAGDTHAFYNYALSVQYGSWNSTGLSVTGQVLGQTTSDVQVGYFKNTATTHNQPVVRIESARTAINSIEFLAMYSGSTVDREFSFRIDGNAYADGAWNGAGADVAEWAQWHPDHAPADLEERESRVGEVVVMVPGGDDGYMRPATEADLGVIPWQYWGVVTRTAHSVGNSRELGYRAKYLKDDFGRPVLEEVEVLEWTHEVTEEREVQATDTEEREEVEIEDGAPVLRRRAVQVPRYDVRPVMTPEGEVVTIEVDDFEEVEEVEEVPLKTDPTRTRRVKTGRTERRPIKRTIAMEAHVPVMERRAVVIRTERVSFMVDRIPDGMVPPDDAVRTTIKRPKLNPEYDPARPYIPPSERPDEDIMGYSGRLRVRRGAIVPPEWGEPIAERGEALIYWVQ